MLPRMDGLWDRGEYDLGLARRMGELDLFTDGLVHEGLGYSSPLAAGLVNMEISRGDGSLGTILVLFVFLALIVAFLLLNVIWQELFSPGKEKILEQLGLQDVRVAFTGAAPLPPDRLP